MDVEAQLRAFQRIVYETADKVSENSKRTHQDWFDETDEQLADRNSMRNNMLQTNTCANKSKYTAAKSKLQQYTRMLKSDLWEAKAKSLQHAAVTNDMKSFYGGLPKVYGPVKSGTTQLTVLNGSTVLQEYKSENL